MPSTTRAPTGVALWAMGSSTGPRSSVPATEAASMSRAVRSCAVRPRTQCEATPSTSPTARSRSTCSRPHVEAFDRRDSPTSHGVDRIVGREPELESLERFVSDPVRGRAPSSSRGPPASGRAPCWTRPSRRQRNGPSGCSVAGPGNTSRSCRSPRSGTSSNTPTTRRRRSFPGPSGAPWPSRCCGRSRTPRSTEVPCPRPSSPSCASVRAADA